MFSKRRDSALSWEQKKWEYAVSGHARACKILSLEITDKTRKLFETIKEKHESDYPVLKSIQQ